LFLVIQTCAVRADSVVVSPRRRVSKTGGSTPWQDSRSGRTSLAHTTQYHCHSKVRHSGTHTRELPGYYALQNITITVTRCALLEFLK